MLKIYSFENIDMIFEEILKLLGDKSEDVRRTTINIMVEIIKKIGNVLTLKQERILPGRYGNILFLASATGGIMMPLKGC